MPLKLPKTYDALLNAGASEDTAREAAEELADYQNRRSSIDNRLAVIDGRFVGIEGRFAGLDARLAPLESKLNVAIWAIGINAAATVAILGVLLRQR